MKVNREKEVKFHTFQTLPQEAEQSASCLGKSHGTQEVGQVESRTGLDVMVRKKASTPT
jgi:hypothetical protein